MRQELVSKDLIDLAYKFYLIFHFILTLICSVTYLWYLKELYFWPNYDEYSLEGIYRGYASIGHSIIAVVAVNYLPGFTLVMKENNPIIVVKNTHEARIHY